MKPRPTTPKSRHTDETAPSVRVTTRTIFVKDPEQSVEGFRSFEEADEARGRIGPDNDTRRVRVLYRNRTDRWDLLVKVARQVPLGEDRPVGE